MNFNQPRTAGLIQERIREKTIRRSACFGLIQWDEVISAERVGYDLHIQSMTTEPVRIFINGKQYE